MRSLNATLRRLAFFVAFLTSVAVVGAHLPAGAQTTQSRLDEARRDVGRLKSQKERLADAFARADSAHHNATHEISETQDDIDRAQGDIASLQSKLKDRIRAAYRMRGVGFFQFLLEARSFRDFNLRLVSLQRQTLADEDLILKLRKKRHELELKQRELEGQKAALESRLDDYKTQGRQIAITLNELQVLQRRLQNQLTREQLARLFSVSRTTGGRVIPLGACPVGHPHVVTNSFGASRGGGTRRHQGNDIMAPQGTPILAVNSGTITRTGSGGLGGIALYLWDGSTEYYYAHLSRLSVRSGQKVSAGQLVGSNGDTGNAQGGPPHLHFEIHPGGGGAIDPYPSLSTVC
jgi:murein DD-endopeptidase MepM/ murein hydrolase activator NlpD